MYGTGINGYVWTDRGYSVVERAYYGSFNFATTGFTTGYTYRYVPFPRPLSKINKADIGTLRDALNIAIILGIAVLGHFRDS